MRQQFSTRAVSLLIVLLFGACASPPPTSIPPTPPLPLPTAAIPTPTQLPPTTSPTARPARTETPIPVAHRIGIRIVNGTSEFFDRQTNARFVPRGVNYFYIVPVGTGFQDRVLGVGVYDKKRVAADFQALARAGYNSVRVFIDSCQGGSGCIAQAGVRGLNAPYLDNLVEMMQLAKENGIYLLLTSNDIPDDGGYGDLANSGSNAFFAGYRNAHFLTAPGVSAMKNYWHDLLSELIERRAPFDAVLGWSLLNEQWFFKKQPPLSLNKGQVTTANGQTYDLSSAEQKRQMLRDGIVFLTTEVRDEIRKLDPTALVTMGFFVPAYPNPIDVAPDWYVDTAPLLMSAPLDFFDFHAYPGGAKLRPLAENFGMIGYKQKPIVMGEVGAFISKYNSAESAARAVQGWIADSCELGFDGWLYWGYYRAPEAIGDATWGFTDANGLLLKALAPTNRPDPCAAPNVPSSNLALGKPVKASNALPDKPPQNVVDGSANEWISGGGPTQWIEIDLQKPATVRSIRLVVAQYPDGETVHRLFVKGSSGQYHLEREFSGFTSDNQVLEYAPDAPLTNIRFVRVETVSSPSWVAWKEIEVIAP